MSTQRIRVPTENKRCRGRGAGVIRRVPYDEEHRDDDNENKEDLCKIEGKHCYCVPARENSLVGLIKWNIGKAFQKNPCIKLEKALQEAGAALTNNKLNVSVIKAQRADERHLSCALLAWQQMGHSKADSLYSFLEKEMVADKKILDKMQQPPCECPESIQPPEDCACQCANNSYHTLKITTHTKSSHDTPKAYNIPLISQEVYAATALTKTSGGCHYGTDCTVMRAGTNQRLQNMGKHLQTKIEQACCQDNECIAKLSTLENSTKALKVRLGKLARREAHRVELLERAETAWFDLEAGYIRRHRAVIESEDDLKSRIKKLMEERKLYKEVCERLLEILKPRGDTAEEAREKLKEVENKLCETACERLKIGEEATKVESLLADAQCEQIKTERDIKFREDQVVRKMQNLQAQVDSGRGLAYESERALRAELTGLKNEVKQVSKLLLKESEDIENIKKEIDELKQEKAEIIEDLEGCQQKCDGEMQKKLDFLKEKRAQLQELKNKVLDCKCRLPMDVSIEVKRTPSLAALCHCEPEDKALVCVLN